MTQIPQIGFKAPSQPSATCGGQDVAEPERPAAKPRQCDQERCKDESHS